MPYKEALPEGMWDREKAGVGCGLCYVVKNSQKESHQDPVGYCKWQIPWLSEQLLRLLFVCRGCRETLHFSVHVVCHDSQKNVLRLHIQLFTDAKC